MKKYFKISGFWKSDNTKFTDYVVTNYEDDGDEDDNIFFYGLDEDEIKNAINQNTTCLEFVITSYTKI